MAAAVLASCWLLTQIHHLLGVKVEKHTILANWLIAFKRSENMLKISGCAQLVSFLEDIVAVIFFCWSPAYDIIPWQQPLYSQ